MKIRFSKVVMLSLYIVCVSSANASSVMIQTYTDSFILDGSSNIVTGCSFDCPDGYYYGTSPVEEYHRITTSVRAGELTNLAFAEASASLIDQNLTVKTQSESKVIACDTNGACSTADVNAFAQGQIQDRLYFELGHAETVSIPFHYEIIPLPIFPPNSFQPTWYTGGTTGDNYVILNVEITGGSEWRQSFTHYYDGNPNGFTLDDVIYVNLTGYEYSNSVGINIHISSRANHWGATIASFDFGFSSLGAYSAESGLTYNSSVVPVPAAAWLFGSGLLGLIGVARRKRTL